MIIIKEIYCPKNHKCPIIRICPTGAISQKDIYSAPQIDDNLCSNCGECSRECNVFQFK